MRLGEIIKQYRIENNLTTAELASKCGLSKGYISMLENNFKPSGRKKDITPSIQAVKKLANGTGIEFDTLLASIDGEVSVGLYFAFHLHSVHLYTILWAQVVAIFIQVTWHYLIAHPSRNTNLHSPLSSLVGSHLDCDVTIPGVFRSLLNSHFLSFHVKC